MSHELRLWLGFYPGLDLLIGNYYFGCIRALDGLEFYRNKTDHGIWQVLSYDAKQSFEALHYFSCAVILSLEARSFSPQYISTCLGL